MRRHLAVLMSALALVALVPAGQLTAASRGAGATSSASVNGYAHVARTSQPPAGASLLVVHGTQQHPERPPWSGRKLLRYVQAAGQADIVLHSRQEATRWAQQTARAGWDGAYLDVMDWRDAKDRDIAAGLRDGLGGRLFITNGYPFGRTHQWSRDRAVVAQALSIADGFQWECAHLGDAAQVLPASKNVVVLWLVCGDMNDQAYATEFARWDNPAMHYYGRRLTKMDGGHQPHHRTDASHPAADHTGAAVRAVSPGASGGGRTASDRAPVPGRRPLRRPRGGE